MTTSDLWKSAEYYRNLASLEEAFPKKKVLTLKDMRTYLGIYDNRALKNRYNITGRVTKETFAVRLAK